MTRRQEKLYPFFFAIISGSLAYLLKDNVIISTSLFSSSVTLGAIVAGFTSTCLAVLTGLDSEIMRKTRKTKNIYTLSEYLGHAIFSGFLFSFLGILCLLFFDIQYLDFSLIENILFTMWGSGLGFCLSCLFRLSRIMLKIFANRDKS